ncbi:hypothetical protein, partial [Brucella sp. UK5/01]|uniref:hypothetical protein n=2 Tax=unclassified Brucella TaxID=2632610 RepID=UPI0009FE2F7A
KASSAHGCSPLTTLNQNFVQKGILECRQALERAAARFLFFSKFGSNKLRESNAAGRFPMSLYAPLNSRKLRKFSA